MYAIKIIGDYMKIIKYVKMKSNKYKVIIDDLEVKLYDDVILKYQLLRRKEITPEEFEEITEYNDNLEAYYKGLKYLNTKMRTEKEVFYYLNKTYSRNVCNDVITKLKENGYINKDIYLKAYVDDQVNLGNNGPEKIKKDLVKLGYEYSEIEERLNKIDDSIWLDKVSRLVDKKIKINHSYGSYKLKEKILYDLSNIGYYKWMIEEIINQYEFTDDLELIKKEYNKIYNKLKKKYDGSELNYQVKMKLLQKGFSNSGIEKVTK